MARKTFISYKYTDSCNLRDAIINSLRDDARFYKGEKEYNDLSRDNDSKIQNYLKEMIFDTSVTIVIVSQNMKQSDWVEWEIKYSLKNVSRDQRISKTNGIICVIDNNLSPIFQNDFRNIKDFLFPVILENTNNKKPNAPWNLSKDYVDFVTIQNFLSNPNKYIEDAFNKSQNTLLYNISINPANDKW